MNSHLSRFLDTNGDGTGTKNAIGDYSSVATDFFIAPPAGEVYEISRLIVQITDATLVSADTYGALPALTNGISFLQEGKVSRDLTDGVPIKTNAEWAKFCYDTQLIDFGAGNKYVSIRWTLTRSGAPIILNGDNSDKLILRLNDNLIGLVSHFFLVQGLFRGRV